MEHAITCLSLETVIKCEYPGCLPVQVGDPLLKTNKQCIKCCYLVWKLYASAKFRQQEIRWNFGILRNVNIELMRRFQKHVRNSIKYLNFRLVCLTGFWMYLRSTAKKLFKVNNKSFKTTSKDTAQKMKFYIKGFFSKCDQIRRKLRIWSHLLTKSLMENFIFCAVRVLLGACNVNLTLIT